MSSNTFYNPHPITDSNVTQQLCQIADFHKIKTDSCEILGMDLVLLHQSGSTHKIEGAASSGFYC